MIREMYSISAERIKLPVPTISILMDRETGKNQDFAMRCPLIDDGDEVNGAECSSPTLILERNVRAWRYTGKQYVDPIVLQVSLLFARSGRLPTGRSNTARSSKCLAPCVLLTRCPAASCTSSYALDPNALSAVRLVTRSPVRSLLLLFMLLLRSSH